MLRFALLLQIEAKRRFYMKKFDEEFDKFRKRYVSSKQYVKHCVEHQKVVDALESVLDVTQQELLFKLVDMHLEHSTEFAKSAVRYFIANKI